MKTISNLIRTGVLSGMILFTLAGQVYGQHTVGFIGGLSSNNFKYVDYKGNKALTSPILGFSTGAMIDLEMGSLFHLYTGILYTKKGGIKKADRTNPDIRIDMTYLEVPLLFKLQFGKSVQPYVMAGPSLSFLLDSKAEARTGTSEPGGLNHYQANLSKLHSAIDIGITGGAGVSVPVKKAKVFIEARYTLGLSDVHQGGEITWKTEREDFTTDSPSGIDIWNRSLQIMAGVAFPLSN
jgi:opacity protein-like surface antigen